MTLERLWAGWRSHYVAGTGSASRVGPDGGGAPSHLEPSSGVEPAAPDQPVEAEDPAECVFCRIAASGPPSVDNGILWVGSEVFAVLNAYPYASGHVMVLPLRHVDHLGGLAASEGIELWEGLGRMVEALESAYGPEGLNLGANLGRAAGAGIPRHLHFHAVPRWVGDTNFMTAVCDTRVLPETLAASWHRLREALSR
ncbi:MAG: HIT family protein [Acidimicrobiales bacterium]